MSNVRSCTPSNPYGKYQPKHEFRNPRPSVRTQEELDTTVKNTDRAMAPWKALNSLGTGIRPLWGGWR